MQAAADAVARVLGADSDNKGVNLARPVDIPRHHRFCQPAVRDATWWRDHGDTVIDPGLNAEQRVRCSVFEGCMCVDGQRPFKRLARSHRCFTVSVARPTFD